VFPRSTSPHGRSFSPSFPVNLGDLKKLITEQEALSEKAETELSELLKKLQEQYETGQKAHGSCGRVQGLLMLAASFHEMGDCMCKFNII